MQSDCKKYGYIQVNFISLDMITVAERYVTANIQRQRAII